MKRFVLSVPPNPEGMVHLYEKDYHYLVRVRRLKSGSCFDALLPNGTEVRLLVLSTVDKILIAECLDLPERIPATQLPPIALFQGLPKGTKMDTIVRQAAEGGVSVIAPFETEYSAVRPNPEKLKRWDRIVREARQQSGSATETIVRAPCDVEALLAYWESVKANHERPLGILLHQEPLEKGSFHDYIRYHPDYIALAVGSEGGFSPKEKTLFLAAGFKPLLMGNTILRVETAAVYAVAALRIIMLERESWKPKE